MSDDTTDTGRTGDEGYAPQEQVVRREMNLVLTNISKRPNIRSLLLTAAAFECKSVFVVGQRTFDFDPDGQDMPKQLVEHVHTGKIKIVRFEKWRDFMTFKEEHDLLLIGVEIHQEAKNIEEYSSCSRPIAFIMGNEGQGLNDKHMSSCDGFVRIPQYGGGTASLNVNVAASIILHRYHQMIQEDKSSSS